MVYLIAQPTVKRDGSTPDLRPLAQYGEVAVLVEAGEYPSFSPEKAVRTITQRLQHFDAEEDFVAWAGGDTLSAVLVGAVLAQLGHRCFRWLRWERGTDPNTGKRTNEGHYSPVNVMTLLERMA